MDPSVFPIPYQNARIFPSPLSYNFAVTAGPKFLRLHFYPGNYSDFKTSESFFSVTANEFTLLGNFSAFLYSQNLRKPSFMKEFVVNVKENQRLDLTFSPSPNSFAFINGIEIVSMPDTLNFRGDNVPIKFDNEIYYLQNETALENLYRLNVGGGRVEIKDDSGPDRGMFRYWSPDDDFIFGENFGYTPHIEGRPIKYTSQTPPHSAPPVVYATVRNASNYTKILEWAFPVDSGVIYLLRLHFCEILQEITKRNDRAFTISINNEIAETDADIISWTVSNQIPIFKDYLTLVDDDSSRGKQDLRLSLKPYIKKHPKYETALLNGIEMFGLIASNPEVAVSSSTAQKIASAVCAAIWGMLGIIAIVAVASFSIFTRRRWKVKDSTNNPRCTSRARRQECLFERPHEFIVQSCR